MRRLAVRLAAVLALTAGAARAQDEGWRRLELRVTAVLGGGRVVVDHGEDLGLDAAERILFRPLGQPPVAGSLVSVEPRSATVALADPSARVPVGTRGEAWVPLERPVETVDPSKDEPPPALPPERPPWEADAWEPGMPLLAEIEAVRPEERDRSITARAYYMGEQTFSDDSDRHQTFLRAGTSVHIENPYGRGGGIHLDGEVNYRLTNVEVGDEDQGRLRFDRASYRRGGTRFEPTRWEAGRFLHHGMPELGVLDGFEYGRRLPSGDRVGASIGFLPEPTYEQDSGEDLQVAAWYEWFRDESERVSLAGGFQHTWHNGDPDRDLLVLKARVLPPTGWTFHGTAWIDFYLDDEDFKSESVEVTQAYLTTGRSWESGDGMTLSYDRLRYPELERSEPPVLIDRLLEDGGYDRLSWDGWRQMSERKRYRATVGLWDGADESGGDLELGLELDRPGDRPGRLRASFFTVGGQFSDVFGARAGYHVPDVRGSWDGLYEISTIDHDGFDPDSDDLVQHRLRGSRVYHAPKGWDLSLFGEAVVADDVSVTLGFHLAHGF